MRGTGTPTSGCCHCAANGKPATLKAHAGSLAAVWLCRSQHAARAGQAQSIRHRFRTVGVARPNAVFSPEPPRATGAVAIVHSSSTSSLRLAVLNFIGSVAPEP
jgi:hypothetical protein